MKEGAVRIREIKFYEPWFFLLFGVFHMHRIWGLSDRKAYAESWHGLLLKMFDIHAPYWTVLWSFFILIGIGVFILGCILLKRWKRQGKGKIRDENDRITV